MEPSSQFVQFPYAGSERPAYLACPEGTGPFPAVIVIHEIFGLNENIKDTLAGSRGRGMSPSPSISLPTATAQSA